jgi:hypothetical protein
VPSGNKTHQDYAKVEMTLYLASKFEQPKLRKKKMVNINNENDNERFKDIAIIIVITI